MGKRILYVTGFGRDTRARDLAHAFERYGRLVRCDIPGARRDSKPFAFVEYEDSRDADDAYDRMHDEYIDDHRVSVQWAKRPPARSWRFEDGDSSRRSGSRHKSRSRSPQGRRPRSSRAPRSTSRDRHSNGRRGGSRDDYRRDSDRNGGRRYRDESSRSRSRDRRSDSLERGSHRQRSLSPRDVSPAKYHDRRNSRDGSDDDRPINAEHDVDSNNGMNVDLDPQSPELAPASPRDDDAPVDDRDE
ncbi:hypothetical protein IW140_002341 [Coemansia sp. RSA 1813]|nr:hypothetical protein EV178_002004 [Coemansia sp. RSA 1646]KAJ1771814.1 hypothetical protein LPJ74_001988 [Coemansia sp. RSA 1843]KAJ2090779.1 hypothetical protein IW138_002397 [Coemansia sp. RSA 986]KAJ2216027.1 hypothetical protein EV179_001678 [Coemansia sp. RSA 487]KAJ2570441.1 hypothetical protein IW140_002341 [Coemansia sp. RSA 1813]